MQFDPKWGGPAESVVFPTLTDWTASAVDGIKYYSGTAVYTAAFEMGALEEGKAYSINLGDVKAMARVTLNGKDLGIVWTNPWRVCTGDALKEGENQLQVEVVNLWQNRLIGDEALPYDGPAHGRWPKWMTDGTPRESGRVTFTTWRHYSAQDPLLPSGLLGPVQVEAAK